MRLVGFPVAMGNAEPAVRAVARVQVGDVERGGLVEALELALASRPPAAVGGRHREQPDR
jgi:hydroxymethylpyrimidine pyrophosphatase-like HAD family hydrolase